MQKYNFKMTDNESAKSRGCRKDTNYCGYVEADSDSEALRKVLSKYCEKYDLTLLRDDEDPEYFVFLGEHDDDCYSIVKIEDIDDESVENLLDCGDPGFGEPFVYYIKNENGDYVFDNCIDEDIDEDDE